MIAHVPKWLPRGFGRACVPRAALIMPSQRDVVETGTGGPSPPQTNAFAISPFRGEGGQTRGWRGNMFRGASR